MRLENFKLLCCATGCIPDSRSLPKTNASGRLSSQISFVWTLRKVRTETSIATPVKPVHATEIWHYWHMQMLWLVFKASHSNPAGWAEHLSNIYSSYNFTTQSIPNMALRCDGSSGFYIGVNSETRQTRPLRNLALHTPYQSFRQRFILSSVCVDMLKVTINR